MSWWDKYFAPGDIRARNQLQQQQQQQQLQNSNDPTITSRPPLPRAERLDPARRARRQNGLLFGGLAFTILSAVVTRRAVKRKNAALQPRPLTQVSNSPAAPAPAAEKVDGGLEAVQALGLATLNVFSMATLSVGAAMWYLDVAELEDLRDIVRKAQGHDMYAGDAEGDREIETWIAGLLSKKDGVGNLGDGVKEKLLEMEKIEIENQSQRDVERK